MSRRLAFVLSLVALPLAGSLLFHFGEIGGCEAHASLPVHAVLESQGGFACLALAVLMTFMGSPQPCMTRVITSSLIIGGVLDSFHAVLPAGNSFVWLRTLSTFAGGMMLMNLWWPQGVGRWRALPAITLAVGLAVGIITLCLPNLVPVMLKDGVFSGTAQAMNLLGGMGYLAGAFCMLMRNHDQDRASPHLLAATFSLFGAAGLLFTTSSLWHADWWWWHAVRYLASLILLGQTARWAQHLHRSLLAERAGLEQTVQQRTADLHEALTEAVIAKNQVDHAYQRIKADLDAAARVQRSLLPSVMPEVPGFSFAYAYHPCEELAGDTLNVFEIGEDYLALYLLDVSGHGVQAALLASTLSHVLSPMHHEHSVLWMRNGHGKIRIATPREVAESLNERFPLNPETNQYFTIHYGLLHRPSRSYRFVSCGHPCPILVSGGKAQRVVPGRGAGIGILPSPVFEEMELQLSAGDRLYFFSDGVLEAANAMDEQFQDRALLDCLDRIRITPLDSGLSHLFDEVQSWIGAAPLDDISAIGLELKPMKHA